jgi:TetR/AcrR family transcriptional regulator, regulator of cefoperazone and chloramphenicol sensitivity
MADQDATLRRATHDSTRSEETRARIMSAAAEVFARDGVWQPSMAAILRAAGQRNETAIGYHFGSREQLALAIIEEGRRPYAALRVAMLDGSGAAGELPTLARAVDMLIEPQALMLETHDGRNHLRIVADLFRTYSVADRVRPRASDVRQVIRLVEACLVHLPEELVTERVAFALSAVVETLALRATDLERHSQPNLDGPTWVRNLRLVVCAILTAPEPDPA